MKPRNPSCLIIADGRLPGLCAAWAAGVVGSGVPNRGDAQLPRLFVAGATPRGDGASKRAASLQSLAPLCRLTGFIELSDQVEPDRSAGFQQSFLLLAACREAIDRDIARVIWPIQLGVSADAANSPKSDPDGQSLDSIADACDRAMLAAQLANIDAGRDSMGVTIEMPYLDFSDSQMIELALDMGVPLADCWWCRADGVLPCGSCADCRRWQAALATVNPGATLVQVVARQRESTKAS